eukprot:TRINITY_DN3561_c0_g1_i2.p2 TRINITY_DN3561_c0_g1~~TRINITY_DN3561_c0_g1_i2.p2  ORF type:complete len:227 (+),score=88.77 TRINITY_DN3561_c0_g1_i2:46-726(+)
MDPQPLIKYLKVSDAHDKNIKLAQYVMKIAIDYLGKEHPFEAKRAKFHAVGVDCRRILSMFKWGYQVHGIRTETGSWGAVAEPRQLLKVFVMLMTGGEQATSDLSFWQSKDVVQYVDQSRLDWNFAVFKCLANIACFLDELTQLQLKKKYCACKDADPEKVKVYLLDISRHRLALLRQFADICLYLTWADNWKRFISSRMLNVCGMISSLIGLYETYAPHKHTTVV